MALFGNHSLLDRLLANPDLYMSDRSNALDKCVDVAPLGEFLSTFLGNREFYNRGLSIDLDHGCIYDGFAKDWPSKVAVSWLQKFRLGTGDLTDVFAAATFLANKRWMFDSPYRPLISISHDMGADSKVPEISLTGLILLSTLILVHVLALCSIAVYASIYPRWTGQLDAFTMMRIVSSLGEQTPLKVAATANTVSVLDETPGWLGDLDEHGECGRVGLGGSGPVRRWRAYECYDVQPAFVTRKQEEGFRGILRRLWMMWTW
ncbi:hypothetical protein PHISP_04557 [Aspergillus sp. HF37]|nr:hypothetical protein PHISP_04557 [Aspergillus sp. HF37]